MRLEVKWLVMCPVATSVYNCCDELGLFALV